jgi:hypothetical protein
MIYDGRTDAKEQSGRSPKHVSLTCGILLLLIAKPSAKAAELTPAESVKVLEQRVWDILDNTHTPGMIGVIVQAQRASV